MGLIKATVGAAGGVLADQWRDYIYGGEMNADVLVMKGKKTDQPTQLQYRWRRQHYLQWVYRSGQ